MQLDGWQTEFFGNLSILDLAGLVEGQALDAFSHVRAGCNSAATSKGLELDVGDDTVLVDADLEFHDISATTRGVPSVSAA